MCNGQSIKNTCGGKQYAPCVYYEKDLPTFSHITDPCVSLEDTTEDLYNLIDEIKASLNLNTLAGSCISYPSTEPTLIQTLIAIQNKVCSLENTTTELNSIVSTMQQQIEDLQNNICQ